MVNEAWRSPVTDDEQDDRTTYKVVLNHEEQYSIWPAERENAPGWSDAGQTGTKAECLAYIERVWTDMRPLSLRRHMEQAERGGTPPAPSGSSDPETGA
jgi:MbtH protein